MQEWGRITSSASIIMLYLSLVYVVGPVMSQNRDVVEIRYRQLSPLV